MPKLIVGLGNPGSNYSKTRHNVGWMALEKFAQVKNIYWRDKFKGSYAEFALRGDKIFLLKPKTFMNLSGESVVDLAQFYKIATQDILVLHDELDIPFGTLALKNGGGAAGHNGLKSIIEKTGTPDFKRLRIGIGRPIHPNMPPASYVLSNFDSEEEKLLDDLLSLASEAINCYINENFEKASSLFSRKSVVPIVL